MVNVKIIKSCQEYSKEITESEYTDPFKISKSFIIDMPICRFHMILLKLLKIPIN